MVSSLTNSLIDSNGRATDIFASVPKKKPTTSSSSFYAPSGTFGVTPKYNAITTGTNAISNLSSGGTNYLNSSVVAGDKGGLSSNGSPLAPGAKPVVNPLSSYGKDAEMMQAKDPSFLDRRNEYDIQNIVKTGDTSDANIKKYLASNPGYSLAPIQQQEATFQRVKAGINEANNIKSWDEYLKEQEANMGLSPGEARKQLGEQGYNDFRKTFESTAPENIADFQTMISAQIAGNRGVNQAQGAQAGQQSAVMSNMTTDSKVHVDNYDKILNLQKEGRDNQKIATFLKTDLNYVNDISQGNIGKYAKLTPEQEAVVNQKVNLDKESLNMTNEKNKRDTQIAHDKNVNEYNTAVERQKVENDIQAKNMSSIARLTGVGYSSTGQEGLNYVYQKGQNALSDLATVYNGNDTAIHNQIKDVSDAYVFNTKLYDLQAKENIKQASNAFFNQYQAIRTKYGDLSEASMKGMSDAANTFIQSVQQTNKEKLDRQDKLNADLEDRKLKIMQLNMQSQLQNYNISKPEVIGVDENGQNVYGNYNKNTGSFDAMKGNQTSLNETPVDIGIKNVYGSNVKLAPTVGNMVINAYNTLKDQGIDLKIADSTRSFNTQKQSYESGKEGVAKPGYSFHERGQAFDLSQLAKDGMFVNGVLRPEVKKALEDAGLQQLPSEPRHRSYGEMGGGEGDKYSEMADTIMSPTGKLKLSDVSIKDRPKVAEYLTKKQEEALNSGDIYGVMAASAGGDKLDATSKQQLGKLITVIDQMGAINNILTKGDEEIKDPSGNIIDISPITGWISERNPRNTDAQELKATLQATVPNLARGVYGEVGVLTDNDIANYIKTIPNLRQTDDVKKAVLAMTMRTLRSSLDTAIENNQAAGVDMSGYKNYYKKLTDKIDAIDKEIGINNVPSGSTTTGTGSTPTTTGRGAKR